MSLARERRRAVKALYWWPRCHLVGRHSRSKSEVIKAAVKKCVRDKEGDQHEPWRLIKYYQAPDEVDCIV